LSYSEKRPQWTAVRVWHRAKQVLREEGLKSLWFKILGETVYRRLLLLERVLEGGETQDD
jgi:hypothetical protein